MMNMKRVFAIAAIAGALVCPGQVFAQNKPDTLYYQVKVKSGLGNEGTRDMYVKGANFRFDYDCGDAKSGTRVKSTAIRNKDGAFLLPSSGRQIGKYPAGSSRYIPTSYIPGPCGDVKAFLKSQNAKKVTPVKVGAIKCDAYTYKDKTSNTDCKLLVNPKTQTPAQLLISNPVKGGKTFHRTVSYVTYKRGVSIPDSKFEIPKGVPIIPMRNHNAGTPPKH